MISENYVKYLYIYILYESIFFMFLSCFVNDIRLKSHVLNLFVCHNFSAEFLWYANSFRTHSSLPNGLQTDII